MIKTIIFLTLFLNTLLFANINAIVSIAPQLSFVKAIAGNKANISIMVQSGDSPHTYEPKPSQMIDISKADIYFAIGVEFENAWLKRFASQNKNMKIIDTVKGIQKEQMPTFQGERQTQGEKDPHVWLSPKNIKIIAKNIYNALAKADNKNANYYKKNYKKFIKHITLVDEKIKNILKDTKRGSIFMVFHPSWGYFARQYHLIQLPIEIEGKSIKPKSLIRIIKIAKKQKVKAIFTQPEFSPKIANQIANELHIKVLKASPLNPNWENNLINFAKAIAN
ncbi:MAG: zinc ABC transporter substrate-binding protein [Campylobacteraceae bacterium]|nr:zinc ABC transporter substrate-binding protein [Campylobacteraceae bacterium]